MVPSPRPFRGLSVRHMVMLPCNSHHLQGSTWHHHSASLSFLSPRQVVPGWVEEIPPPTESSSHGSSSAHTQLNVGDSWAQTYSSNFCLTCILGVNEVDYSRYPSREIQLQWLHYYLEAQKGTAATPREVERLYAQVNRFALVSVWIHHSPYSEPRVSCS